MANKLISDLTSAAVLVTDLIEHQPIAGPPSKKGTVTALFSDASGNLVFDRDARTMYDSFGINSLDFQNREGHDSAGTLVWSWDSGLLTKDTTGVISSDFDGRALYDASFNEVVNWNSGTLETVGALNSVHWKNRQLIGPNGATVVLNWNSNTILVVPSGIAFQVGNAAIAGAVVPTHTITLKDSTGTTYRVPCLV